MAQKYLSSVIIGSLTKVNNMAKSNVNLSLWNQRYRAFRFPLHGEKRDHLVKRWGELPEELKTPNQISGRHLTHCGFTLGASYCSFHCTHCYLPKNANQVPIPSLEQMKEQIDANRRFQGPGGGLQITGGDVADAYWRAGRPDELVEIIRYAYSTGLVPMLFTHGQTLIENPDFLERLIREGGLRQMAVHIDMTQAGRHGYPIQRVHSEADLHPIRQAFTDLALSMRKKTGAHLELAHNCTVTRRNIEGVSEIIKWFLAKPDRSHVWRMLSFQPEADTGRTMFSEKPITPEDVWIKIQEGTGFNLRREATIFGHPECNSWASLLINRKTGQAVPLLLDDVAWDQLMGEMLAQIGGLSLVTDDARTAPYRLLGVLFQNPNLTVKALNYTVKYLLAGRMSWNTLFMALQGKVHTLGVGMHNFMDAARVANAANDHTTQCRLDSCVFKGAVKKNGEWEAVPMCAMNQKTWSDIYQERLEDLELRQLPQVPSLHEVGHE